MATVVDHLRKFAQRESVIVFFCYDYKGMQK